MFSFGNQQQQQPAGNLFGQQPQGFGAVQPAATGGMFGSSISPSGTSLFGSSAPQPAATGGLFGQPSAAPSPFAQPSTGGGMFGQPAASSSGGLFGQAASTMGSALGGFGGMAAPANAGTSIQKYTTTKDVENGAMRLISISAMDAYKNKSIEELRWEDYQAGRTSQGSSAMPSTPSTGSWMQPAASSSTGIFGGTPAPSPISGGVFGQTPAASTGGIFGTPAATPSSTGIFGQPQQQPASSAFGQTASTGIFGQTSSTPSTQPAGGMFGGSGIFGNTQQSTTTPASNGIFGQPSATPASTGIFGQSGQQQPSIGTGIFGQSQPSSGGIFGTGSSQQTSTSTGTGLFNQQQPSSGFGQQQTTGTGLFGTASTTNTLGGGLGGGLGSSLGGGLGSGGIFGTSQTQPAAGTSSTGIFGGSQPSTTSNIFGTSQSTPASNTGSGLFGTSTSTTPSGGLFGPSQSNTGSSLFPSLPSSTNTTTGSTGSLFGTGTSGGIFGTSGTSNNQQTGTGLFGSNQANTSTGTTGGIFGTGSSLFNPSGQQQQQQQQQQSNGGGLGFAQSGLFGTTPTAVSALPAPPQPVPRPTGLIAPKALDKDSLSAFLWKDKSKEANTPLVKKSPHKPSLGGSPKSFVPEPTAAALGDGKPHMTRTEVNAEPVRLAEPTPSVIKPTVTFTTPTKQKSSTVLAPGRSTVPQCSNHNLWTKPSLEAMSGMSEQELARIEHFQIGAYGVGSVTWPGLTDVRFLVIDDIIQFKKGAVTLFPDEDLKPPVGTGLNKTAVIELLVRPKNYDVAKKHESKYVAEMQKLTEKNGAEFLSYDLETWRFRVEHFSTWGIDESQWALIDTPMAGEGRSGMGGAKGARNDLSVFSRLENEIAYPDNESECTSDSSSEREDVGASSDDMMMRASIDNGEGEEFVGALAVAPPTREELKAMGWDLRILDLFLNQSFRVSLGMDGSCFYPEHPVVCETYELASRPVEFEETGKITASRGDLIVAMMGAGEEMEWESLIPTLAAAANASGDKEAQSVIALVGALVSDSPTEDLVNTSAFNDWLSKANAATIRSTPALAFSPAAGMSTRDHTPSASQILINAGCPRLALAVAAGGDDACRQLMRAQMEKVQESSKQFQEVADVLGGKCELVQNLDWRMQLALRYWYKEGDLSGFEPPHDSIEWKLIKAIVLNDSALIYKLIDVLPGESLLLLLVATHLIRLRNPELVEQRHFTQLILVCSHYILSQPETLDWQLSPLVLSLLPLTVQKEKLIEDVVLRNVHGGTDLLERFEIVSPQAVANSKALQSTYYQVRA